MQPNIKIFDFPRAIPNFATAKEPKRNFLYFSMSISVGPNFSFSWNTKSMEALPSRAKKKASPSTLRRNKRRREEFLKKKSTSLEIVDSDKDASQIVTFSCDECEHVSKTDKGLKIHKGKTHKSVENLRRSSTDHPLKVSPIKEVVRLQPCNNCAENMSSSMSVIVIMKQKKLCKSKRSLQCQ